MSYSLTLCTGEKRHPDNVGDIKPIKRQRFEMLTIWSTATCNFGESLRNFIFLLVHWSVSNRNTIFFSFQSLIRVIRLIRCVSWSIICFKTQCLPKNITCLISVEHMPKCCQDQIQLIAFHWAWTHLYFYLLISLMQKNPVYYRYLPNWLPIAFIDKCQLYMGDII